MSNASETFNVSIKDSENLLKHFNSLNTKPPPPDIEVLKRAGLVMAMTAWETYVEDRLVEINEERLKGLGEDGVAKFVRSRLELDLSRLHNPNSVKTIQLFKDYADIDITNNWKWNNFEPKKVRDKLDEISKLRGDVVHRSRKQVSGPSQPDPVNKEALEKVISFLKNLVIATEEALLAKK